MPKKILIVEDEANIRELLRLYLERLINVDLPVRTGPTTPI